MILDFRLRLGNRCKVFLGISPNAAVILDFRPRLGNRCKVFLGISPNAAVILDFGPRLGNRCKDFPGISPNAAVILDFRPRLGNRCKETLMNAPLLQGRMARLPITSLQPTPHSFPQHHPARLPAIPPRTAPRKTTPHRSPHGPSGTTRQGSPASRQKAPGAVARAFLSENHPLDERGLVGVWNEGEGGEWLRDNQGSTLPRGY